MNLLEFSRKSVGLEEFLSWDHLEFGKNSAIKSLTNVPFYIHFLACHSFKTLFSWTYLALQIDRFNDRKTSLSDIGLAKIVVNNPAFGSSSAGGLQGEKAYEQVCTIKQL